MPQAVQFVTPLQIQPQVYELKGQKLTPGLYHIRSSESRVGLFSSSA